ncbi:MAG: hypothetical protein IPJ88_11835 [Myxococcales bacterium]|nr:MAG: hypothetical protein IPJ88_11835 [Myxococcales bacterium]
MLVGESSGALLAIASHDGSELSRIEAGYGFSASISVASGRAYVMSNGGRLFSLQL